MSNDTEISHLDILRLISDMKQDAEMNGKEPKFLILGKHQYYILLDATQAMRRYLSTGENLDQFLGMYVVQVQDPNRIQLGY